MTDRSTARANLIATLRLAFQTLDILGFKTAGTYDRHLWSASLDYFRTGDLSMFLDGFIDEIRNQLTRAFNQGARDVGVDPSEYTQDDKDHLQSWIDSEYNYVLNLAQAIQDLRTTGVSLDQFRTQIRWRINLWANRYNEVVNEARVYFGGKVRLVWVLGSTHEHCPQCAALAGTVAFATEWDESGIRPQHPPNPVLGCGGWRCSCSLQPTDQRRSPRALDKLTGIAVRVHI